MLTTHMSDNGFEDRSRFIKASTPFAAIIAVHPTMIVFTAPHAYMRRLSFPVASVPYVAGAGCDGGASLIHAGS